MKFEEFLSLIPKISNLSLPGKEAQFAMAPMERVKKLTDTDIASLNPRQAAVMALFYKKNEDTYLVLILRKTYKGVHSNQVGFPGGKVEKNDIDLLDTALRETYEEVGVPQQRVNFVKTLTNIYIPPSNFWVQSFIGYSTQEITFIPQEEEVETIIEVPLQELLDKTSVTTKRITTSYMVDKEVPVFILQDYVVWGATAMMLNEIKALLIKSLEK